MKKRARGFTLLELMIVVAVIAILAGLAITAYSKQVRKSRRAEAVQYISDLALREEKWRSTHTTYGSCTDLFGSTCTVFNASNQAPVWYSVDITNVSGTRFTISAAPRSGKDQTKDTCGTLSLDSNAGTVTKSPTTGCW